MGLLDFLLDLLIDLFDCDDSDIDDAPGFGTYDTGLFDSADSHAHDRIGLDPYDLDSCDSDLGATAAFNPATGLPMVSGTTSGMDVGGNPYGCSNSHFDSCSSIDEGIGSGFGDSFGDGIGSSFGSDIGSGFGSGSIGCGSGSGFDDW